MVGGRWTRCSGKCLPGVHCPDNLPELSEKFRALWDEQNKLPFWVRRLLTFTRAMVVWAWGGFGWIDERRYRIRRGICDVCPERDPVEDKCRQCGCNNDLKIRIRTSSCPLGKW